ncbi:MAG: hypothetical protein GC153_07210 [Alphaproteobacteria bacterium]|nr:hypothetical protein [Alphaproteobacteria bacterium]
MTDMHAQKSDDKGWADSPGFRRLVVAVLVIGALVSAALGFLPAFHKEELHFPTEGSPFPTEEIPVFFAVFGFLAFSFIVLAGQHLRKLVMREERYYDERE